jgi:uncharacterized protein (TIGR03000 family)
MYKQCFPVVAGLLAVTAFALCPATASAQRRGDGGAWRGGTATWRGDGWRGDGWGWRDGGWNRGWGWGGWGIGLGWPYRGYGYGYSPGYYNYGYTDNYPYYASSDYYYPAYGSSGAYIDGSSMYGSQSMPYGYGSQAQDNEARIRVIVPQDAKLWFGNSQTQQNGQVRFFESPALTPGKDFTYDVKAQWRDANGKDVTQTRQITVRANEGTTVDFMRPTTSAGGSAPPTPAK